MMQDVAIVTMDAIDQTVSFPMTLNEP